MNAQKQILVCEDDPVQLRILTTVIERAGYRSLAARSPGEGLTMARRSGVDAVITDVQLLDGSGFDLVGDLHRIGLDAPVIMATAYATDGMRARAHRAGVRCFLEKPLDPRKVREHVDRLVRHAVRLESRVLIVEERDSVRAEIQELARRAGFTVLGAKDGAEALEILGTSKPPVDLLLADLHTPGLPGVTLIREALRSQPDLYVVMMTGEASRDEIREGYRAGAVSLVRRPISPERFETFLRRSLSAARGRRCDADRRREREERRTAEPWGCKLARGIRKFRHRAELAVAAVSLLLGVGLAYSLDWGYESVDRCERAMNAALSLAGRSLEGPKEEKAFTRWHLMEQLQLNRQANEATRRYYEGHLEELKSQGASRGLPVQADPFGDRPSDRNLNPSGTRGASLGSVGLRPSR